MGAGSSAREEEEDAAPHGAGDDDVYRIINQLIRARTARLGEDRPDEEESDEDQQLTLKEALDSTESLMMGAGRGRPLCPPPDLSKLQASDITQLTQQASGRLGSLRGGGLGSGGSLGFQRARELGGLPRRNGARSGRAVSAGETVQRQSALLPNRQRLLAYHPTKTFCAQFSESGQTLITASQDHKIRFYSEAERGVWEESRQLIANDVGWSILDVVLSPDGQHLIYGTWSDHIHEFSLYGPKEGTVFQSYHLQSDDYRFCIFSLRFSADGAEILAGASDRCLYVFDREYKSLQLKLHAHEDDINAVCFGDEASNMVYSGGDDGLVKVWDRRELRDEAAKPVGSFAGHSDGVTFIDSRGDGRFLLSNSKDQTMKLWDLRAFSTETAANATREAVSQQSWDYRWQSVPRRMRRGPRIAGDSSVMTYRGAHTVQHTLIRCAFSPAASTGQSLVVSGCARGGVVLYDLLSGELVSRLSAHNSCVRDFSWHPHAPLLASAGWDGRTLLWRYDERRLRNLNPEADEGEGPGDEDSEDEEGRPNPCRLRTQPPSGTKRARLSQRVRESRARTQASLGRLTAFDSSPSPSPPPVQLADLLEPSTPPSRSPSRSHSSSPPQSPR